MVATDAARNAIVGVWKLVSYQDRETESDPWTQTLGEKPRGIGVYHPTGLLSMQGFADPASGSKYFGYIGTFTVREARQDADGFEGVLEHRMESASDPDLLIEDPARPFWVSGAELIIGDRRTWRRTFERLVQESPPG